jgi:hypothetical protein
MKEVPVAKAKILPPPVESGIESDVPNASQMDETTQRFWQTVEQIRARNADKDPDEVLREVTEVVEEVRRERYERELLAKGGC